MEYTGTSVRSLLDLGVDLVLFRLWSSCEYSCPGVGTLTSHTRLRDPDPGPYLLGGMTGRSHGPSTPGRPRVRQGTGETVDVFTGLWTPSVSGLRLTLGPPL